ncbi:hypothetical protein PC129_g23421, partial [Phytophthora cactorum]
GIAIFHFNVDDKALEGYEPKQARVEGARDECRETSEKNTEQFKSADDAMKTRTTCPRRRERRRGLLAVELSKGTRCDLDLATDGVALPAAKLSVLDPINGGIVKYGMECCAKRSGGGTRASWRLLELL